MTGLPLTTTRQDILSVFEKYGVIQEDLQTGKDTNRYHTYVNTIALFFSFIHSYSFIHIHSYSFINILIYFYSNAPLGESKIKLYEKEGVFKGDALVVYFKEESVRLAVQMLDDSLFLDQQRITVQPVSNT